MSKWQRTKGHNHERATVNDAVAMGLAARRFTQCGEKDVECDVQIENDYHAYDVEVKKGCDPPMRPAFAQAQERCQAGHIPCARVTADGKGFDVAIIGWHDFLNLLKNYNPSV